MMSGRSCSFMPTLDQFGRPCESETHSVAGFPLMVSQAPLPEPWQWPESFEPCLSTDGRVWQLPHVLFYTFPCDFAMIWLCI